MKYGARVSEKSFFDTQLQLTYIIKKLGQNLKNENGSDVEFDFLKQLIPFFNNFEKNSDLWLRTRI